MKEPVDNAADGVSLEAKGRAGGCEAPVPRELTVQWGRDDAHSDRARPGGDGRQGTQGTVRPGFPGGPCGKCGVKGRSRGREWGAVGMGAAKETGRRH